MLSINRVIRIVSFDNILSYLFNTDYLVRGRDSIIKNM